MNTRYKEIIAHIRSLYPGRESIPLHEPVFAGNEKKYLLDCIDSTYVSSVGKYVDKFESMIRDYTGADYAVATVNGTAALHIALKLAGVKAGDLVITQPLTYIATCNAIAYCGAEPVFTDIEEKSLGMSAEKLEQWLQEKTVLEQTADPDLPFRRIEKTSKRPVSACVPMHTFGHPCEIDRIAEICKNSNIALVEDSAESLGSKYKGRHTGNYGLSGVFSFNGNKTITTGGGGMIITGDESLAKQAKHLTTQARIPHGWKIEHDQIGHNYRMPNLNAALGCAQIERIDDYVRSKRELAGNYAKFFREMDIPFITEPPGTQSNYWLNSILLDDEQERDSFLQLCHDNGVLARPCWALMHKLPMFRHCLKSDLTTAEQIEAKLVNIPSGARL
jgi:perosamine synthetase